MLRFTPQIFRVPLVGVNPRLDFDTMLHRLIVDCVRDSQFDVILKISQIVVSGFSEQVQ